MFDSRSVGFVKHFMLAYPGRSLLMVALLAFAGMAEGVSVATLVPLLELAGEGGAGDSTLARTVRDLLGLVGLEPSLLTLMGLIVAGITLKALSLWLAMREVGFTVARVTMDLRLQLMRALLRARWRYFGSQPVGRLANAISSEAIRAASAYREACVVLASVLQIFFYLLVAAFISWWITAFAAVAGLGLLVVLRRFIRMSRDAGQAQTTLTRSLTGRLVDAIQGIKAIKAMAREDRFLPLLEDEARGLNEAHRHQVVASEGRKLLQEPLVALLLGAGVYGAVALGNQPFSAILAMAFIFYRLMQHVNTLQMRYQVMAMGESAFWSLRDQIERADEEREPLLGARAPAALRRGIELRSVTFGYDGEPVLRDVSLEIPAGEFVAIAGPSGAGKTTVADLIIGLHRPHEGEVHVDGAPLREIDLEAWRGRIGYVPQEGLLFNDTIRRNVTLGDESIGEERVVEALRAAGAWEFVASRPEGLDAEVGERGAKISGGQRQRLTIARALVNDPLLLVLDEATTALDPATEAAICRSLAALRGRVTILAISHQPAIREVAGRVYLLEGGRVRRVDAPVSEVPG